MHHLSSKQWSIWSEGLLIAKLGKKIGILWFSCPGILFERLGAERDGNYSCICLHFTSFAVEEEGRNLSVTLSSILAGRQYFLQVSEFPCVSVPEMACLEALPLSCVSLASKDLGAEDCLFLPPGCGLWHKILFPALLVFPAALSVLQCYPAALGSVGNNQ